MLIDVDLARSLSFYSLLFFFFCEFHRKLILCMCMYVSVVFWLIFELKFMHIYLILSLLVYVFMHLLVIFSRSNGWPSKQMRIKCEYESYDLRKCWLSIYKEKCVCVCLFVCFINIYVYVFHMFHIVKWKFTHSARINYVENASFIILSFHVKSNNSLIYIYTIFILFYYHIVLRIMYFNRQSMHWIL